MLRSINRWLEANRWAGDAVVASGLLVLGFVVHAAAGDRYGFAMSVLLTLPLYARRSLPRTVLLVVVALCLVQLALLPEPVFGDVAAPLVVHSVTAYVRDRRWGIAALITGLVGAVLGALHWRDSWVVGTGEVVLVAGAGAGAVVAAYLLGARQRDQRERVEEQVGALQERNRLLAVERDQRAEMAAAAERARIARELHDIVAHSLSVIVVQADGGAAAITAAPDSAAELAPRVLGTIAGTSREALAEMRRIVAVLRSDSGSPTYAPAPGTTDLPALVAQVAATGIPITLETRGSATNLPPTTELTVYRVVQESLTNVLKHAGTAAQAWVTVSYLGGAITVDVLDDGRGSSSFTPDETVDGHGLLGMQERVLLQGGSLRAGPRTGGGFAVHVTLPLADRSPVPQSAQR